MTSTITGKIKPRIEIAPGVGPADDPSTFVWEDAGKRRQKVDIQITAGRDDEADEVEAGSFGATMDNRNGRLSPRNVLGDLYGRIGRGTPLRVVLDRASDDFTRTVSGSWGTSPDGFTWTNSNGAGTYGVNGSQATAVLPVNNATIALLNGAGSADVEVTWSTTLDVAPTGASFVSAGLLRHSDASNYIRAHVELQAAGTVAVKIQRVAASVLSDLLTLTSTAVTYTAGTKVWGKARADGPYIMVKTWTGLVTDEPDAWQGVATDDLVEGSNTGLLLWRINTNVGTYTAKVDDFDLVNIVWSGNVPEWSPKWPEKSGTDSTIPLAAAGILRRLSQGKGALNSPLFNLLNAQNPFTYYPLEQASGATQALSVTGDIGRTADITFAGDDTLNGSATAAVLNTYITSAIQFKINSTPTADGFSALWFFRMDSPAIGNFDLVTIRATGTMATWVLTVNSASIDWHAYDKNGVEIASPSSAAFWSVDPTKWVAMQLETNVSGGVTTVTLLWHQVGETSFFVSSDTYTGTSVKPDYFFIAAPSNSMSIAHLWFGDNDLPFVDSTFVHVADGYRGELAADRIDRLCRENNVPTYILAGDSEPVGRQRVMKLVDLLRECEEADQGILCERGNALMYIPRVRRYSVPVAMALDWSLGHLDEAPEPTDDDQRLRNQWTVSRVDGSSVTVSDPASVASAGTYDDSAELNINDDSRLIDFATWFLSGSTADNLRWPRIKINLIAHPELIPQWLACRIGSRITIANPPAAQLAGQVIDLIIEGYTVTLNNYVWTVELACSPASAWEVGEWDDDSSRWDSRTTTLKTAVDADDTALVFRTASSKGIWSTTGTPYGAIISGIEVTVTSMGAASLVSGAYDQAATVSRSVHGFDKPLAAGEPIHVADPGRWAL